ncbi:MAG: YchJ family protein [Polyangiaceae bacterium]
MTCVCGKGESLETCCGPYLNGKAWPETAEALMRARYAAYATNQIDFILDSHHPTTREQVDRNSTEAWSKNAEWIGLDILQTEFGGPADEAGMVEFIAKYKIKGVLIPHREKAQFEKLDGKWYFVDGKEMSAPTVRHEGPKTGRNDPCPCGSGKKFKKCCGKAA